MADHLWVSGSPRTAGRRDLGTSLWLEQGRPHWGERDTRRHPRPQAQRQQQGHTQHQVPGSRAAPPQPFPSPSGPCGPPHIPAVHPHRPPPAPALSPASPPTHPCSSWSHPARHLRAPSQCTLRTSPKSPGPRQPALCRSLGCCERGRLRAVQAVEGGDREVGRPGLCSFPAFVSKYCALAGRVPARNWGRFLKNVLGVLMRPALGFSSEQNSFSSLPGRGEALA